MPIDHQGKYVREEGDEVENLSVPDKRLTLEPGQESVPRRTVKLSDKQVIEEVSLEKRREVMNLLLTGKKELKT